MRIKTGAIWQDMGPGSGSGGLVGHRSAYIVALEEPRNPTAQSYTGRCVVCSEPTIPGRFACGPAHQKIAYGDRRG